MKKLFLLFFLSINFSTVFAAAEINNGTEITEIVPTISEPDESLVLNRFTGRELLKAVDEKKLIVAPNIELQLNQLANEGYAVLRGSSRDKAGKENNIIYKAYPSAGLSELLCTLVKSPDITPETPFSIISLLRIGGAHGEVVENGDIIGRAVDIDLYSGKKIHIDNPETALNGILQILQEMPPLRVSLGLPKPGWGNNIDPVHDYFLPVNNPNQARRSPSGKIEGDLKLIKNEYAREKLKEILAQISARVLFLYPDAPNHLHIKVIEPGKIQ